MTDEQTKQAILGFTEFFKGITGNQDLEIPSDIAEKFGIEKQEPSGDLISRQAAIKSIEKRAKRIKNEDTLNGLAGAVGILFELPSVNPAPSGDNVSRQAVIDVIDNWVKKYGILAIIPTDEVTPLFDSIHKLHSVNPQKWIPVSERLPDECDYKSCYEVEDGAVLWTNEEGLVGMGYYYESTKTWSDIEDNPIAVIAWMPLPPCYEPQENGECGMISDKLTTDDGEPDGTGGQIFCP